MWVGRELRAPFRVGLFNFEFLAGVCRRSPQPAEGGKAKKTGDRREQNTAVDHGGLRATGKGRFVSKYAARQPELHRSRGIFFPLLPGFLPDALPPPSLPSVPAAFARPAAGRARLAAPPPPPFPSPHPP